MALTPSTMLELGTPAPAFSLPDTEGQVVNLADFDEADALLVIFMCNHCPFVVHLRDGLAQLGRDYEGSGLAIVGINSNDADAYPADNPANMKREKAEAGYNFPYLFDASQGVAKAYEAACTPDFFLFDKEQKLAYRGQFDESRPSNGKPVTGADLRQAIDALLAGQRPNETQRPSVGCNIKWRAGNAPSYFG